MHNFSFVERKSNGIKNFRFYIARTIAFDSLWMLCWGCVEASIFLFHVDQGFLIKILLARMQKCLESRNQSSCSVKSQKLNDWNWIYFMFQWARLVGDSRLLCNSCTWRRWYFVEGKYYCETTHHNTRHKSDDMVYKTGLVEKQKLSASVVPISGGKFKLQFLCDSPKVWYMWRITWSF